MFINFITIDLSSCKMFVQNVCIACFFQWYYQANYYDIVKGGQKLYKGLPCPQ